MLSRLGQRTTITTTVVKGVINSRRPQGASLLRSQQQQQEPWLQLCSNKQQQCSYSTSASGNERKKKEQRQEEKPFEIPKTFEDFFGGGNKSNQQQQQGGGGRHQQPEQPSPQSPNANVILGTLLGTYILYKLTEPNENGRELTWQAFRTTFLDKGMVDRLVVVNREQVRVYLRPEVLSLGINSKQLFHFSIGSVSSFENNLEQAQDELGIPSNERIPVTYRDEGSLGNALIHFAPTLLLIGAFMYLSRSTGAAGGGGGGGQGLFGIGKSKAKMFNQESSVKVKFNDVAGADEAKEEIMEFVKFLKNPAAYERLGATIPKGAILSGPPGTGKTLLAKATAGEAGVPFLSVSGSEFVEMFVGVGPSRVRYVVDDFPR